MAVTDSIADMLTRIRNAARNKAARVDCRQSKICAGIAKVLQEEGYITAYSVIEDGRGGILRIDLRYGPRDEAVIHQLTRMSKPGRRLYTGVAAMPKPLDGLGIVIVSTPQGVLSDRQARLQKVGGELLCTVE